ncbi:MAG TPA: hypothetical protein VFQ35_01430, partial [Polyangiaceae bacterium]|nr:hypothetical protein [Polyangiaceae bacterium]
MSELRADCARCEGLCCVVLAFDQSPAFAFTKPLNTPCPHLSASNRCEIYPTRGEAGFHGCGHFDCYGAGQRATELVPGPSWREDPERARRLFAAFCVALELHELLLLLDATSHLALPTAHASERDALVEGLERDARRVATEAVDISQRRRRVHEFLRELAPFVAPMHRRRLR